ncbi:delta12-fatty acid desaturase [Mycena rebaudengoi]|nr:delta12-fatty acid desaturase [Mycena rebaudengoi]
MAEPADELATYIVPDLTIKQLLDSIPPHCFKRSAVKSSMYTIWHLLIITAIYKVSAYADTLIKSQSLFLPHPVLYSFARFGLWSLYGFWAGLFGAGIWVIAHEAGHQAFSESKTLNNTVGWILHFRLHFIQTFPSLGVPYHSWRITHAKHHASNGHMTEDQVWVPRTRTQFTLQPFDPKEHIGVRAFHRAQKELWLAMCDSPIGTALGVAIYLLLGWPAYVLTNIEGQHRYPNRTNHFNPNSVLFSPHQRNLVLLSNIGVALWFLGLFAAIYAYGFAAVFTVYLVPYLWVNHWLILITFLQHTDPLVPHYRAPEFTFSRGALSTLDRRLLGDLGNTHVVHHVCSKIPHYNAWEASDALRKVLGPVGVRSQGRPAGWAEMYRVFRECKFVEDEGNVVFYKNSQGLAKMRAVFSTSDTSALAGDECR